jgi:hypothetical protein
MHLDHHDDAVGERRKRLHININPETFRFAGDLITDLLET